MYSQGHEEKIIVDYFNDLSTSKPDWKGKNKFPVLLDIGANDGKTFSNSLRLIELGWMAFLVEPAETAYQKLHDLHGSNPNCVVLNYAIGTQPGKATLHESGCHLKDKSDVALLSSLKLSETDRWKKHNVTFTEKEVDVMTYAEMVSATGVKSFDFITIDAEGFDLEILKQIDLANTKMICVEWNMNPEIKKEIINYAASFGLNNFLYESGENLILAR